MSTPTPCWRREWPARRRARGDAVTVCQVLGHRWMGKAHPEGIRARCRRCGMETIHRIG